MHNVSLINWQEHSEASLDEAIMIDISINSRHSLPCIFNLIESKCKITLDYSKPFTHICTSSSSSNPQLESKLVQRASKLNEFSTPSTFNLISPCHYGTMQISNLERVCIISYISMWRLLMKLFLSGNDQISMGLHSIWVCSRVIFN